MTIVATISLALFVTATPMSVTPAQAAAVNTPATSSVQMLRAQSPEERHGEPALEMDRTTTSSAEPASVCVEGDVRVTLTGLCCSSDPFESYELTRKEECVDGYWQFVERYCTLVYSCPSSPF